jgi:predicted NBD/HSP70 family sugar kinase
VIYVKVGTGIGAGLISGGELHRGADGCAGDIGHISAGEHADVICRCGAVGCLEALAGGAAIGRDGAAAAASGQSQLLGAVLASGRPITARDVADAAHRGDSVAGALITQSARLVGESIARMVNFFNPSLILVGGGVAESGDAYLATVRQVVFQRSLPLATRSLQITRSPMHSQAGLRGAAFMVIGELFSRELLSRWAGRGRPTADLLDTASLV